MNEIAPERKQKKPVLDQSHRFNDIPANFSHHGPHDWPFLLKEHV
ncbi:hypothetical protein [Pseudomonas corrugata]